MKNSLFKRAAAAAAAIPLALTQCLTYSFAAEEEAEDVAVIATAEDAASSNSFTLENSLYIAPDKTESEWNIRVANAIDKLYADGKTTGTLGTKAAIDAIVKNAGQYSDFAEAVLSKVGEVKYEIGEDKNVTITVDVANVSDALEGDFLFSLGRLNNKLAEKYGDADFANIDYSSVNAAGTFTITVNTSELATDTKVAATLKFTDTLGNEYTTSDAVLGFVSDCINSYKQIAKEAVDQADVLTEEQKQAAYDDIDSNVGKYERIVDFASKKIDLGLAYSNTASSIAELIADVNGFASRYTQRALPESAAKAVSYALVKDLYAEAQSAFNNAAAPYTLDYDLNEIADFADNQLRNVEASAENGNLRFYGEFDDAEAEQVAAWYAENVDDKEYVSSYKFIEVKADGTQTKNLTGTADLKIKRVVITKDKTTTTSTTTTTTTTTTDEISTTSTDESTTTSTTTTGATVADVYVDYEADYGFYTEQDAAFAADQVSSFKLLATYEQFVLDEKGNKEVVGTTDPVEISGAKFTFASTPAETYSTETFKHDIALVAAEDIKDEAGNVLVKAGEGFKTLDKADVTVEVYVGLKGDANLDNKVTPVDASYVLVYYAELSAGNVDSNKVRLSLANELAEDPAGIYDNFAAFLADIKNDVAAEDAWAVGKVSRKNADVQRSLIATDASAILVYASIIADGTTDSAAAWAQVIGE